MCKKIGSGLAALGAGTLGGYLRVIRPWQLRWGATDAGVNRALPGDAVVTQPTFSATRAVTIQARPAAIWPWLVQIGVTRVDALGHKARDSPWYWGLDAVNERQTRRVTRVRLRYHWTSPRLLFDLLVAFADIVMMRKGLLGIKERAE